VTPDTRRWELYQLARQRSEARAASGVQAYGGEIDQYLAACHNALSLADHAFARSAQDDWA